MDAPEAGISEVTPRGVLLERERKVLS